MRILIRCTFLAALGSACSPSAPASPLAPTGPPPPVAAPAAITLSGKLTATNGGQPLAGVTVTVGSSTNTTDGAGAFAALLVPSGSVGLALTGAAIVPRTLQVAAASSRDIQADAIALGDGFDLTFYRQFVRGSVDTPGVLQPLRRWTTAPQIYLRTVDEAGAAMDGPTLDLTERVLRETVPVWTSGQFTASIERGADSRAGVAGWLTVRWLPTVGAGRCGQSDLAVPGGTMDLYYREPACRCAGSAAAVRPFTVRHELGHALGFWHTDATSDLMSRAAIAACDLQPSARERLHAAIAYARPVGNTDPDNDPASMVTLTPMRAIE